MPHTDLPGRIRSLDAYSPGLSIDEIRQKYNLSVVIKMASNENPLGCSPLVQQVIARKAPYAFRYPQSGNPRLCEALAERHKIDKAQIAIGNGSDEIIDLLMRILCEPRKHSIACFEPCFSIYPIQAQINGLETRRCALKSDFSFDFDKLLEKIDGSTRLCFVTTPDNPSGYCPEPEKVAEFAQKLSVRAPECLLVIDEAYMDFAPNAGTTSLLESGKLPANAAVLRTFSKSYGLAGLRIGYGILPDDLASYYWRARLPFSLNILAEEAAIAALEDYAFREATIKIVREGRKFLATGLARIGCHVWPSAANFLMFKLPKNSISAAECFEKLLAKGIIIRKLASYNLPDKLRVSIGNTSENLAFIEAMEAIL